MSALNDQKSFALPQKGEKPTASQSTYFASLRKGNDLKIPAGFVRITVETGSGSKVIYFGKEPDKADELSVFAKADENLPLILEVGAKVAYSIMHPRKFDVAKSKPNKLQPTDDQVMVRQVENFKKLKNSNLVKNEMLSGLEAAISSGDTKSVSTEFSKVKTEFVKTHGIAQWKSLFHCSGAPASEIDVGPGGSSSSAPISEPNTESV